MSQRGFDRPPPAEPLCEADWLDRTDRAEVGREAFFCGRDAEYEVFRRAAKSLDAGQVGGGTIIFQGAPGAGKSALLLECMEAVRLHSTATRPWIPVRVEPEDLQSPDDVVESMVHAANAERRRLATVTKGRSAKKLKELLELGDRLYRELSSRGGSVAGFSVGPKLGASGDSGEDNRLAARAFRSAAPLFDDARIVVFVDESQNTPVKHSTKGVLHCLHYAQQGIKLLAAFFGLSDTKEILRKCGLSRLSAGRVVNVGLLPIEDATASLRRMLDAYYEGSKAEKLVWASALAELSQGWPQHINRVGVAAGRVLRANGGRLERRLLESVLEKGSECKNAYYFDRVSAGGQDFRLYRQMALAAAQCPDGILPRHEIQRLAKPFMEQSPDSFNAILTDALHAGLLMHAAQLPDHYRIPIPSLGDYLSGLPEE